MIRLSVPPRWSLALRRARVVVYLLGVLFAVSLMTQLLGGLLGAGPLLGLVLLVLVIAAGSVALLLVERWMVERVDDARNANMAAVVFGELAALNKPVPYALRSKWKKEPAPVSDEDPWAPVLHVPELVPDDDDPDRPW